MYNWSAKQICPIFLKLYEELSVYNRGTLYTMYKIMQRNVKV